MEKLFDQWNEIKKALHAHEYRPPLFKERDIWWCSFGVNVGSEVCGKNAFFRRPMLILKKLSQTSCIGVPLSTQEKTGSWYITVSHNDGKRNTINLAQIRYLDFRRFDKKLGAIDTHDFQRVKEQVKQLLNL